MIFASLWSWIFNVIVVAAIGIVAFFSKREHTEQFNDLLHSNVISRGLSTMSLLRNRFTRTWVASEHHWSCASCSRSLDQDFKVIPVQRGNQQRMVPICSACVQRYGQ